MERNPAGIPTAVNLQKGDSTAPVSELQQYLSRFGWLRLPGQSEIVAAHDELRLATLGHFDDGTEAALADFQTFYRLPATGRLDAATLALMQRPRCGVPDRRPARRGDAAEFVLAATKWDKPRVTWQCTKFTNDLSIADVIDAVMYAYRRWCLVSQLDVYRVGVGGDTDIEVRFEVRDHGDGNPFDDGGGPMGNILAHGFYPPPSGTFAGDLHFDDFETWTRNDPPTGIDLDTVALHEGGHTLGLDHSADPNAVMYAFYGGAHRELYDDDIAGIRERYGVRTRTIWSDFDATVDGQVDFASKAYFFKGAEYLRYDFDNDLPDPGFPAPIAGNWNGLPDSFTSDLDTTISGQGDLAEKLFFFKGSQYVRYDWREQRVDEGPLPIAGNWGGFPDAFTSGIDAAVSGNGDFVGFAFFFRGAEYIRYDWLRDSVGSDYPAPIAGYWPGLPEGFVTDIQAALNGRGPFDGKLYLFKGMQYLRFDWAMDNADTGYPLPIELYWM